MNLETKEGALRFCELRRREMVGCFEHLGRFEVNGYSFGAYVFATHEIHAPREPDRTDPAAWKTGKKLDHVEAMLCRLPECIGVMLPPEKHTLAFREVLKSYARITRSLGVVVMTEMWHLNVPERAGKSFEEDCAELPDSIEDVPGRGEALLMQLEHSATGRRTWWADIRRNPTSVEPWQEHPMGDASGRLVDLVDWRS